MHVNVRIEPRWELRRSHGAQRSPCRGQSSGSATQSRSSKWCKEERTCFLDTTKMQRIEPRLRHILYAFADARVRRPAQLGECRKCEPADLLCSQYLTLRRDRRSSGPHTQMRPVRLRALLDLAREERRNNEERVRDVKRKGNEIGGERGRKGRINGWLEVQEGRKGWGG